MKKTYLSAPLPFVGQKRMFARKFMKVLEQYPESTVFVDLSAVPACYHTSPNDASRKPRSYTTISTITTSDWKTSQGQTG